MEVERTEIVSSVVIVTVSFGRDTKTVSVKTCVSVLTRIFWSVLRDFFE